MGHSMEQITWNFQQVDLKKRLLKKIFFNLGKAMQLVIWSKYDLVYTEPVTKSMFVITEVACYFYPCFVNT